MVVGLMVITTGCGKMDTVTDPAAGQRTGQSGDEGVLPLIDGQGPPVQEPPDSIKAKGETILRRAQPTLMIGGASSGTILAQSRSWLGVPYIWGGNSRSGVDCSHLVYQVYRGSGLSSYPYLTTAAMRNYSRFICVNWNDDGGDIVMFGKLAHTGIYIGGGWMIDANSYMGKVTYDNLRDSYWQAQQPFPVRYMP